MNSKKYYEKKNENFINYWNDKRKNKHKYSFFQACIFIIPFSIFLGILNYGLKNLISLKFILLFSISFFIYYLFTYFIDFRIHEKRYQKLKKEKQHFDH
ncbi:hypothetical protein SAMN05216503_2109 [Polaribacter sp. KT25b]|nr:hypothetical protein SAMN05216503_2109 [Polaribacter sp. KT25b]